MTVDALAGECSILTVGLEIFADPLCKAPVLCRCILLAIADHERYMIQFTGMRYALGVKLLCPCKLDQNGSIRPWVDVMV